MENKQNLIRIFIAINFPDEVVKEIARLQELLSNKLFTGKFTELENIHLTLKFLGEIDEKKLEEVKQSLQKIQFKPMQLKLGQVGIFHHRKNPRLVWVKILGKELYELQKSIDAVLEGLFSKEERFMGHITIARIKYVKDKENFEKYAKHLKAKEILFTVDRVLLQKSDLKPQGPTYNIIEYYPKQNEKAKI